LQKKRLLFFIPFEEGRASVFFILFFAPFRDIFFMGTLPRFCLRFATVAAKQVSTGYLAAHSWGTDSIIASGCAIARLKNKTYFFGQTGHIKKGYGCILFFLCFLYREYRQIKVCLVYFNQ